MGDRAYVMSLPVEDVRAILEGERDLQHANTLQLLDHAVDAAAEILARDEHAFVGPRRPCVEGKRRG